MASNPVAAPQFLVSELSDALASYEEHLGFLRAFVYEDFHASVPRGTPVLKPLDVRPRGARDFYVEDPDGYILCFSEAV